MADALLLGSEDATCYVLNGRFRPLPDNDIRKTSGGKRVEYDERWDYQQIQRL